MLPKCLQSLSLYCNCIWYEIKISSRFYVCGGGGGGGGVYVCVCVCMCAWSRWFLLQSPEMKLVFLLQFISRWKTFTSYVIGAEPWCGATSASANNDLCLLTFAWRWSRIAMTLSAGVPPPGCSKTSVRQYLISNIRKTSLIWYRIIKHIWLII